MHIILLHCANETEARRPKMSALKANSTLKPSYLTEATRIAGAVASNMEPATSGAFANQEKSENEECQLAFTKYWTKTYYPAKRDAVYSNNCTNPIQTGRKPKRTRECHKSKTPTLPFNATMTFETEVRGDNDGPWGEYNPIQDIQNSVEQGGNETTT